MISIILAMIAVALVLFIIFWRLEQLETKVEQLEDLMRTTTKVVEKLAKKQINGR